MGYENPLIDMPEFRELMELPRDQRLKIAKVFRRLRAVGNETAEQSWQRRKAPMALYWRWVSTISRHFAHGLERW